MKKVIQITEIATLLKSAKFTSLSFILSRKKPSKSVMVGPSQAGRFIILSDSASPKIVIKCISIFSDFDKGIFKRYSDMTANRNFVRFAQTRMFTQHK